MNDKRANRSLDTAEKRYRRRVSLVGPGLLIVLYMILRVPVRVLEGSAGFDGVFRWMFGWIGLGFWLGARLLWWRIVSTKTIPSSSRAVCG